MTLNPALRDYLSRTFGVDLRTLALFRAALGAVLLWSLLHRYADLSVFYADSGVLPRAWLLQSESPWRWSLHFANGSAVFQGALIAVQCVLAFAFMVGSHTRAVTIASWVLLVSLHSRNPLVLIGGDYLMVCLLFWSMFLPLGARWSMDAALSTAPPREDNHHLSWASAALTLQVLSVWFFGAMLKTDPVWWPKGLAVEQVLQLDRFVRPFGYWIEAHFHGLLRPLTYYVYVLELFGPLLCLSPVAQKPLRFASMLMLMVMHVGFTLSLQIGHFACVSLSSATVLLGGWFWDWRAARQPARHLKIFYDRDCGFCLKSVLLLRTFLALPRCEIAPAQDSVRAHALMQARNSWVVVDAEDVAHTKWAALVALLRESPLLGWSWSLFRRGLWERPGNATYDFVARHRGAFGRASALLWPMRDPTPDAPRWAQGFAGVMLFVVLAWNLGSIGALPRQTLFALSPVMYPLRLDQFWDMFAPYPGRADGWYVAPGVLADGSDVDVLHPGRALTYARPQDFTEEIKNFRWQAWQVRLYDTRFAHHRQAWAKYLCRQWNRDAEPDHRLQTFKLVYMLERTRPDSSEAPIEQSVLWYHDCGSPEPHRERADPDLPAGPEPESAPVTRDTPAATQNEPPQP